jgi:hypothetical protein
MIFFPRWFFSLMVYGGIALAIGGAVVLLILLLRDWKRSQLW